MRCEWTRGFFLQCRREHAEGTAANERGTAVVVAVLMLALLTFLGIGASTIAAIQVRTAANDRIFRQGFYLAESAVMEAVQRIENAGEAALRSGSLPWINTEASVVADMDAAGWSGPGSACSSTDANTRYAAVDRGVAHGSSLGLGGTNLYSYVVLGRFGGPRGRCLVEAGYRKRF